MYGVDIKKKFVTCNQFHQHFMSNFCTNILLPNNYKSQTVIREMLRKTLMYIKFARLMLMKLTPGPAMAAIKAHPRIAAMLTPINFFHPIFGKIIDCMPNLSF